MSVANIATENLLLRAFEPADAVALQQILMGKDVLKYFPGKPTVSLAVAQRMITRISAHWQARGYGLWAVELRETGALLGRTGLWYLPETDEIEIDFILGREYWGHGYATEAGRVSLQFAFDVLQLASVTGIVHPDNLASQRVLTKLGMQFVEETEYFGMACYRYLVERPQQ